MSLNKEIISPQSNELARFNLALILNKIDQPLFSRTAPSETAFLQHLDDMRAQFDLQGTQLPVKADRYMKNLQQHVNELIAYKQELLAAEDTMVSFLEDIGIVFGEGTVQASDFSLNLRDPMCVVLTYRGLNNILVNSFGGKRVRIHPDQRGWQFPNLPLFSTNPLATNKVVMLLSEFMMNKGRNSVDRRLIHERVETHELQHVLDTIYRIDDPISTPYDLLMEKSLLELAATAAEGAAGADYIMGHLRPQGLFDFDTDPEQLAHEWHDQLQRIILQFAEVRKIPGFSRRLEVELVMASQSLTELETTLEFVVKNIRQV